MRAQKKMMELMTWAYLEKKMAFTPQDCEQYNTCLGHGNKHSGEAKYSADHRRERQLADNRARSHVADQGARVAEGWRQQRESAAFSRLHTQWKEAENLKILNRDKARKLCDEQVGGLPISELPTPFFCSDSNRCRLLLKK